MKLGVEVGLGPVHIALDGDAAPLPKRGATLPNFRPTFVVAEWLDGWPMSVVAKRLDGCRCHLLQW